MPKGSNGGVAVGLPHRNSSVFKQARINQWEVKGSDPPNAVGKLNCFLFVGDVMKLKNVLKSPWTAFLTLTHNYPEELLGLKRLAP